MHASTAEVIIAAAAFHYRGHLVFDCPYCVLKIDGPGPKLSKTTILRITSGLRVSPRVSKIINKGLTSCCVNKN